MIRLDLDENSLVIPSRIFNPLMFEYEVTGMVYNFYLKKMVPGKSLTKMYTHDPKTDTYKVAIGYATYIYNTAPNLTDQDREFLTNLIFNKKTLITDRLNLRDDQFDALLSITRFKRNILSVYTGWGKTELSAIFIYNLLKNAEGNILVLGAKNSVIDEIRDRLERFNIYESSYFDDQQRVNVINPNGFCNSQFYKDGKADAWLSKVRFVIMDEVDRFSDSAFTVLDYVERMGCEYFYGMSATADKRKARRIPADASLKLILSPSVERVSSKFSHAAVYQLPDSFNIDIHRINAGKPDLSYMKDIDEVTHYSLLKGYCTSRPFLETLRKIIQKRKILVPMYFTTVIKEWIAEYKEFSIIMLSSAGYQIFENGEYVENISLEDLKDIVIKGDFDAIFTTETGFSAIDFPGNLSDVLLLVGTNASDIIQYIGRVSRSSVFNIWYITHTRKIPGITNKQDIQLDLIKDHYKYCCMNYFEDDL